MNDWKKEIKQNKLEECQVVMSLGSDLGDRKRNITLAIEKIKKNFSVSVQQSKLYETAPWGFHSNTLFLNCCILFYSKKNPLELLKTTQKIEKFIGREKKTTATNYQSRRIDIDILYVGKTIMEHQDLTLPHPKVKDRMFVLQPLMDICPDLIDCKNGRSIRELYRTCNDKNEVVLFGN